MKHTPATHLATCLLIVVPAASLCAGEADKDKVLKFDLGGGIGMELMLIPAGKYTMGLSKEERLRDDRPESFPPSEEHIARDFYLGKYEVTVPQFRRFVEESGYKPGKMGGGWNAKKRGFDYGAYDWQNPGFEQVDDQPVVCVTWGDAVEFCKWLSGKTGRAARLPTEVEWEYACRAGTKTRFHSGNEIDDLKGAANVADASLRKIFKGLLEPVSWDDGFAFTARAGRFKPNAFGLYDMHGNVSEWCGDVLKVDSTGRQPRLAAGGNWISGAAQARSGFRLRHGHNERGVSDGFRVLIEK